MRVGVTFYGTPEEIDMLIRGDGDEDYIEKLFQKGQAVIDGDSYCPDEIIDQYNAQYGTDY